MVVVETSGQIEITPIPLAERETYLENFLESGVELVKKGRYQEAIKYLRNGIAAKTLGFDFENDPRVFFIKKTPNGQNVAKIAGDVAYSSKFTRGPNKSGTLTVAEISALEPAITGKPAAFIPPSLWHEVALINLEQWLHGLQYLKGSPLTGEGDLEKDVGNYLRQKGVTLATNFSRRHS